MMKNKTDRQNFENWIMEEGGDGNRLLAPSAEHYSSRFGKEHPVAPEQYRCAEMQLPWLAWQAAVSNEWLRINYSDSNTWPENNRPVLVGWEERPLETRLDIVGHLPDEFFPYTSRKLFFMHRNALTSEKEIASWFSLEVKGYYEGMHPTHWRYIEPLGDSFL